MQNVKFGDAYFELNSKGNRQKLDTIMALALIRNLYAKGEIKIDVYEKARKLAKKTLEKSEDAC